MSSSDWEPIDGTLSIESIDETLTLLGTSMTEIHEAIADPPIYGASRETLQNKLDKLRCQTYELKLHRDKIKVALSRLYSEIDEIRRAQLELKRLDSLPDALILFVDVIEKANQYFDYRKSARKKYNFKYCSKGSEKEIYDTLLHDQQLNFKFNKIGPSEIRNTGHAIWSELCNELYGRREMEYAWEDLALTDWIFNLVFQARENGYVMDQNPMLELKRQMNSEPYVYNKYFSIYTGALVKCTEILTEQAHSKYSQFLKDVEAYRSAKPAVEKDESVAKADVM